MMIDLLRHGEPRGGRLYRGNLVDDPLSDKGWQQMLVATAGKRWDFIATSPMMRCQVFARHLSKTQNVEMQCFELLKEIGFGSWQGRSVEEIGQQIVDEFKQNPIENRPKDAEYLLDFQKRVLLVFKEIIERKNNQSILIIAHAGVIRVIKSYLLNLPIEKMFTIGVISASCERFEL